MSRIVARRFMNLQWGSRYIVDNLVEYDPINNIECLANGGGKTVQIFLTNCLFVHRSFWRTRDKGDQYELKDYFKGNASPGVVMVEMFLDGSEHRLLVGMIGNNRGGDFDIYTFVYEYKDPEDAMGIRHIPLGTIDNNIQRILSIPNAITMLEKVKGMHLFDMNQNHQATAYYKHLFSYGIDTKQWENIVMKINSEEGGITHFFKDTDERGIIRDYLFPIVESKLEGNHENDETNIQYIKDTFRTVAKKRKQYDDRMKSAANMEDFISHLDTINEKVDEQVAASHALEQATSALGQFGGVLTKTKQNLENQLSGYDTKLAETAEQMTRIAQEQASDDYYHLYQQLEQMKQDYHQLKADLDRSEKMLESKKKDAAIMQYAQSYESYEQAIADIKEGEMRLEKLSDETRQEKLNNLGYSLKLMTETAVDAMQKKMEKLRYEINKHTQMIEALANNLDKLNREYSEKIEIKAVLNEKISHYSDRENEVLGYVGEFNMFRRHPDGFFENIIKENEDSLHRFEKKIKDDETSIENTRKDITKAQETITSLKIRVGTLTSEIKRLEQEKSQDDAIIENRKRLYPDLDPLDDGQLVHYMTSYIKSLNESIEEDKLHIEEEKRRIRILDGQPNEDIVAYLNDHEIGYITGLDYLRSQSQADILVENNPLVSYAFIISEEDDFKALKKAKLPTVNDPVIFMKRSSIGEHLEESISKGAMFYVSRDPDMLDLKKLDARKLVCREAISKYQENNQMREDKLKNEQERRYEIMHQHLNHESYDALNNQLEKFSDEKKQKEDLNRRLNVSLSELNDHLNAYENDLYDQRKNLDNQSNTLKHVRKLANEYTGYLDHLDQLDKADREIAQVETDIKKTSEALDQERAAKEEKTISFKDTEKDIEKYDLNRYRSYKEGTRISGGFEALSKQFEALKAQMSGDEAMARELIERGHKASAKAQKNCQNIIELNHLSDEDILDVSYDEDTYRSLQNEVSQLDISNRELTQKTARNAGRIDSQSEQCENKKQDIIKEYQAVLPQDQIFGNYASRIAELNKQKADIEKATADMRERLMTIDISLRSITVKDYDQAAIEDQDVTAMSEANKEAIEQRLNTLTESFNEADQLLSEKDRESGSMIMKLQTLDYLDVSKKEVCHRLVDMHESHDARKLSELMNFFLTNLRKQLDLDQEVTNEYHKDVTTLTSRIYEYLSAFHSGLSRIDRYTAVDFNGTRRKLVEIRTAKWDENAKMVESKLNDYMDQCFDESVKYAEGKELDDFIVRNINPLTLYDHTLTLDSIKIYALKIDVDKQMRERWDQYKSGGERTVSSMALVGALMSYISAGLANDERHRPWSVFIMDNPFAQMTAHRLVKPFLAVAEKQHVQLIMFTGVNEESVQKDAKRIIISRLNGGRIEVDDVIRNESQIESITLSRQTSIFDF